MPAFALPSRAFFALGLALIVGPVHAQDDATADTAAKTATPTAAAKPPDKPGQPKPYADVITKDAKTQHGLFTVDRIDDKVYFEIPPAAQGKEMLWVTEIEQLSAGLGYGGTAVGNRVVRWTRRNNTVYLRNVDYSIRADEKLAVHQAIEDASLEPILMAFPVEAEAPDKAAVIDVTKLYTSDPPEFAVHEALGAGGVDASRSYIDTVKTFPTNVETKSLLTFSGGPGGGTSVSATVHYSMVLLPAVPMAGRLADSRVGYFTEDFQDYGRDENRVSDRQFICRWNLVKKDPSAALSDPVKPLVYYVGREVPEKYKPYIKKAIEAWNVAFEQAGFKNAIIARDAPTPQEDPDWDPDDARYSVIRWAPTDTENAMGPNVHDPRSGEILESHIIVWHNVLKLAEDWYFVQASAQDPHAQKLPLPDDLMGNIIQYIVTHEVGHTLGLRHNFKASSSYSIAQLRDPAWTAANGDEASIMDYGRFNYVAQPGDGARLIPTLGPYDKFAIQWGYTPIPGTKTPDDERPALNRMAARQRLDPMLRFGGGAESGHDEDPTQRREDLGDDPIAATRLGLQNLDRVTSFLVAATTKDGDDYKLLTEMYDQLLGQRQLELGHVAALIGGVVQTDWHAGYGVTVYSPVPRYRQAQAMRFLLANAFTTPTALLRPDILYRIEPGGVSNRVLDAQTSLLSSLFSNARVWRLLDARALGADTYSLLDMLTDLQDGLWSELSGPHPVVDMYRRNLQRAYLSQMKDTLSPDTPAGPTQFFFSFGGPSAAQSDLRPLALGLVRDLGARIDRVLPRTTDPVTRLHLQDCRATVHRILAGKP